MKYKRELIDGEEIRVHKNLNNGKWSVSARIPKKGFQVVAHLDTVNVINAIPKISLATLKRIKTRNIRNVCAHIQGFYTTINSGQLDIKVSYNPYRNDNFTLENGEIFVRSNHAHFAKNASNFTIN